MNQSKAYACSIRELHLDSVICRLFEEFGGRGVVLGAG